MSDVVRPGDRRRPPRSGASLALVLTLVAAVLAGCSGSVGAGRAVEPGLEVRGGEAQPVRAFFPGPAEQATQQQIAAGFVRAGAASDGDYETARSFLTPEAAKAWVPEGEVLLYSTSTPLTVKPQPPNVAVLSGGVEGTIDINGRYVNAAPSTSRNVVFEFARVKGEWRISKVPKDFGRWITTSDLGNLLKPYTLHYLAKDRRALVPDRRWFPRDHLATRLARAQLADPPAYLAGSVRNDIPRGSRLTADSVSVNDGIARVEITGSVPTDRVQRENVWAQLVSTLLQDSRVQAVTVRVGDVTLELPGVDLPVRTLQQVGFPDPPASSTGRPVVRRGDSLFLLPSSSAAGRQPEKSGHVDLTRTFRSLAMSADSTEMTAVDPDGQGLSRFHGTTRYEMPFFGTKVGHPAYDTRGFLWAGGIGLDEESDLRLWAFNMAGDPATQRQPAAKAVAADWLKERRVIESKPSPDGSRVAILHTAEDGSKPQLDLAGVVRGPGGEPTQLAAPQRLGAKLVELAGLVWLSDLTVATLARRAGSTEKRRPYVISVDGQEQSLAEVSRGLAITSGGGERDILVTTSDGVVLSRAGQQWISLGPGTDVVIPAR
ncbi:MULTISPECIES: GerMN domain-containing protein [unclassified Knoellia]|uniref:GerMN domain-containing protein n=1 Tax=Knoellia altitudinis TaxID=3404795 RepID=UPI00361731D0